MYPRSGIALLLAVALLAVRPPLAAADALRILRPIDLTALPLLVMQHEHLIERTAEAMGLGEVTVNWSGPDNANPFAMLSAGQIDLAMTGLAPFLAAGDISTGTSNEIRALSAVAQQPYVLVTRNQQVKTILDVKDADRIAVPDVAVSGAALMLEMAAADEWGPENYNKLDRLMVPRTDAVAAEALISGKGDIDSHFSRSPYVDGELADPGVHRVMDSFDIAGPHTTTVLVTTTGFASANGELCKAILAALQAADDLIRKTPGAAAETFSGMVKDESIPLEDLSDMIGDPDLAYRAAPTGVQRLANFMQRIGRTKHSPQRWQDVFLPASRDLPGS